MNTHPGIKHPHDVAAAMAFLCACLLAAALILLLANGCAQRPLKGGRATTSGPVTQELSQGQNPLAASKQGQEAVKVKTYTLPAGSTIAEVRVSQPDPALPPQTNAVTTTVSEPVPVTEREETRATTELGAAQKDTAREIGAKLASLRGVVWVGVAVFLFSLASLFYPPLRALVNSVTTSAVMAVAGLAMMFLPSMVVGNELLIIGVAVGGAGLYWFAHRYGHLRGFVDANKDGIDDRLQKSAGVDTAAKKP